MSEPKGRATLLAELKAFIRQPNVSDESPTFAEAMYHETDRGAVILLATAVEDVIQGNIERRMVQLNSDEKSRIFGPDAPLGSYSAKLRICHALGAIDREEMRDLDLLREMRNACAHNRGPISFKTPQLKAIFDLLVTDSEPWKQPRDLKLRLGLKASYFIYRLKGRSAEDAERQIRGSLAERPTSPRTQDKP